MKPINKNVPSSVVLACAILLAIPLFHGFVLYRVLDTPMFVRYIRWTPSGLEVFASWLVYACVALALARGINVLRWCLAGVLALGLFNALVPRFWIIMPRFPQFHDNAMWWAHFAVLVLCFLPPSNRFFRHQVMPNQLPDPTSPSVTPAAGAAGAPSVAADH